jgi:hypothetical protein
MNDTKEAWRKVPWAGPPLSGDIMKRMALPPFTFCFSSDFDRLRVTGSDGGREGKPRGLERCFD